MSVVKMTQADKKNLKPMHLNDTMTDEQKAARLAVIHEEWNQDNYNSMVRKIASARKDLVEFASKVGESAASEDQSVMYHLSRRSIFETATRLDVLGYCVAMKVEGQSFTDWVKAIKEHALKEAMRSVRSGQSTCMLSNYVDAEKADMWRKVWEGFYF